MVYKNMSGKLSRFVPLRRNAPNDSEVGDFTKTEKSQFSELKNDKSSFFMFPSGKKGQVEITFNWVYILIAGAVILLFFIGLVARQKAVSEERLSGEVVEVLSSILAGAGVSEKTKNFIDASGLADYTLYFDCLNGVGEFGIKGRPARTQNSIDPVFAPREMRSPRIITWSLPYALPFKVMDFLLIIPSNVKYYIMGNDADFINEFLNSTEGIERVYVPSLAQIEPERNLQVRIIDTSGTVIPGSDVPPPLQSFEDAEVSAAVFTGANQVDFYQKQGSGWKKLQVNPVRVISLPGERNAAKYAAVFSADGQMYWCNMNKALVRLELLTKVYGGEEIAFGEAGGKIGELISYYKGDASGECLGHLEQYNENTVDALTKLSHATTACRLQQESCVELIDAADMLQKLNDKLRVSCSVSLY